MIRELITKIVKEEVKHIQIRANKEINYLSEINREQFIDEIIERINKKQLKK